jgi:MurNAc alpha-1-phosphate uridylyltransferase
MILAAGLGTRMRPLTNNVPKPLVKVRGKALIDHVIDRLVAAKVELVIVNLHHHADLLKAHLAKRKDVEIRTSDETDRILGTGGGVFNVLPLFEGEPFFVHNADSIWVEG